MKCIVIAWVLGSSLYLSSALATTLKPTTHVQPTTHVKPTTIHPSTAVHQTTSDYSEKYDHLWLEWVNDRIREGEIFLDRISGQVADYQKTHNEQERVRISTEVEIILTTMRASLARFDTELKNPNLTVIEIYSLEKVKAEGEAVVKVLTRVEKIVAKKS